MKTPAETLAALHAAHARVAAVEVAYTTTKVVAKRMLADALAARGQTAAEYQLAFEAAVAHIVQPGDTIRVTRDNTDGMPVGLVLTVTGILPGMLDDVDAPHVDALTPFGVPTTVWGGDYEVVSRRETATPAPATIETTEPAQ